MTFTEKQTEFVELFNSLESWTDKFQYLIELGNELPEMPEHLKNSTTRITPCNSVTYFYVSLSEGRIHIEGWSNASIPSGIIMLLKNLFDGVILNELKGVEINFHTQTKLIDNLTSQRKIAFQEMLNRIFLVS